MSGDVSPPRSKRRKISCQTDPTLTSSDQGITIYSWNINGITPFLQPSITSFFKFEDDGENRRPLTKASLRDFLHRHGWPTLLFLQEVKISPEDSATIHAVKKAVRTQISGSVDPFDYEAHFCLPTDKYNARGFGRKLYGVCSIIRKDFQDQYISKIRTVSWDTEGRFLVIETKAVGNMPKLAIFNVYAVNGTEQPYKDPETGEVVGKRHDRKLQVHSLLQAECRALEAEGFGVILAGDINIARSTVDGHPNLRTFPKQHCLNRADFEAKFFADGTAAEDGENAMGSGLGLIDTFRHLHPDRKGYTYYPTSKPFGESCDRVDMIIISKKLEQYLKESGMHETPSERGPSDHVPLYAQLFFEPSKEG